MRDGFFALADQLDRLLAPGEACLAWFAGERSDFVRFNLGQVRQAGRVAQSYLDLRLMRGNRSATLRLSLPGEPAADLAAVRAALDTLRGDLAVVPEDPFALHATEGLARDSRRCGRLAEPGESIEQIVSAARGLDLVGLYAAGPIARGLASSYGSRCWHESASFNFDFSLHAGRNQAVKLNYAGSDWDGGELLRRVQRGAQALERVALPPRTLAPGVYRAYLAPAALAEFADLLCWGGFSARAHQTRATPLLRLAQGIARLSPLLTVSENTAEGLAPDFQPEGFAKPPRVPLIVAGQLAAVLVSPRSGREYGIAHNGANSEETPDSLDLAGGELATTDALAALDTGIWIENLWYLNYSDRAAGRATGMTRFATFWVEGGRIVAPVNVMRFDDSVYRMLGENLLALTRERELIVQSMSYGERSVRSWRLPGALLDRLALTL